DALLDRGAHRLRHEMREPHDDPEGDEIAQRDADRPPAHPLAEHRGDPLAHRVEDRESVSHAHPPEERRRQPEDALEPALERFAVLLAGAQEPPRANAQAPPQDRRPTPESRPPAGRPPGGSTPPGQRK